MKRFLTISLYAVLTSSMTVTFPVISYAQVMHMNGSMHTPAMMNGTASNASGSGNTQANQAQRIANIKQRASQEITRRLTALTAVSTRISSLKNVSSTEKTTLVTQIQNEITTLNTLNAKIAADTDLQTLRTDVQSIVASYRIFALFLPVARLSAAADSMLTIHDTIANLANTLQAKITAAQNKGENVTSLQSALADIQTKLNDEKTQATTILSTIAPLTPQGYPGNKSTLQSAQGMLQTGRQDLRSIHQDIMTITTGLKSLRQSSISPTMSMTGTPASPTATVTP